MKGLSSVIKILVYSNMWVGVAVASLCYLTIGVHHANALYFYGFVACTTTFLYNYMRLVQARKYDLRNDFSFKAWIVRHRNAVWFFTLFFGAAAFYFLLQIWDWRLPVVFAVPALVSLIYPLSFKKAFHGFTSLRTFPGLKMFLIAVCWSYVSTLVPVVLFDRITWAHWIEFVMRSFFILALVIPFDMRDLAYDDSEMRTIPQVLGTYKAKQLALFFLLMYQIWIVLRYFIFEGNLPQALALFMAVEIGYWLIRQVHLAKHETYFSFWIEGIPIYGAGLYIIFQWI